ncbi:MAG: carboxypeptidase-like regulatory domain-containing protein [Bryobacteraceae bacterium]
MTRLAVPLISAALVLLVVPKVTYSQQVTAAITGKVSDPSDAPVSGAKVTAKDLDRGTTFNSVANAEGIYNLPRVPVGRYEIRAEAPGFQASLQPSVSLDVNQTARVNFQMKLGQVTETVEVNSQAPLLQTESTMLGTIIDSKTNESLPLATRNYIQLTLLAPGSVHPDPSTMTNGSATGGGGRPYVNGNREQANNFLLDGLDNNQVSDNLVGYTPSVDAIGEFNMITNNASAEFGNFMGGIISTTIKSGTNQFHGDAFEFFRNDRLNANSWSNNWNGSPRSKVRWNMFGATLGGPIKKDKLFFFADFQSQRLNFPNTTGTLSLFTAAERQGDFSQLLSEKQIQLYNPFNIDPSGKRVPFANNQIPLSLLDPVAKNLFASQYYPLPVNSGLQNNYFNTTNSHTYNDQGDIKIDYNISQKDRLWGRYSQSYLDNPGTNSWVLAFNSFNETPTKNSVINWTHTFSSNIVNEVRLGGNYVRLHNGGSDNGLGNIATDLGIRNGNDTGPGLLSLGIGGGFVGGLGNANIGTQQLFADTVLQAQDAMIVTKGKHIFHTGFQFMRQRVNTFYAGNNGRTGFMNFSGRYTAGPDALATAGSGAGAGEGDFFLGLPDDLGRGVRTGTWGQRSSVFSAYLQDDYKASANLTLNLGLRYETHTPWVEVRDRMVNFAPISGQLQQAGSGSCIYSDCRALYNSYYGGLSFQPRFGFAYSPDMLGRKFVVRGAYTISSYLEGTGTNLRLPLNPPINQEFENRYDSFSLPKSRTEDGLTVLGAASDPYAGTNIRLWDPNIKPAIVQQWNLSMQYQFNNTATLQVGYVGQHSTHLMVPMPYFQRQLNADKTTSPSPFLSGNPALANISQISGTESNGNQRYDALQAVLQKRLSDGLQYQVAYTYSKCMTNSSGYYGSWGGQTTPTSPYWQNLYDMKAEWGPCYYDVTHILTSYAVYELPIGRGKKLGKDMGKAANAIIGGWQTSGIWSWHGGFPLTVSAGDASGTNSRGSRANCIAPGKVFGKQEYSGGGYQWFSPDSYGPADPGTFGTCGVGTIRGPGLFDIDASVEKGFALSERFNLHFRTDFVNLLNHTILNSPGTDLGGSLGVTQGSQPGRTIQLALKLYY